jgi:peroxiredoxin
MALTESYMLPLGTPAPDFSLPNVVDDQTVSLDRLKGSKGTLILFMCNHCPYVVHLMDGPSFHSSKF